MEPSESPPPQPPPRPGFVRHLIERRVPHILAIYAGVSWGLVEFTAFAADEFLLSSNWTRMVLVTLLLMLPSVVMLAWFHGKPGKDRDSLAPAERIGIPANVILCAAALWVLFGGDDPGLATNRVTVETEEGDTITRDVVRDEYRKPTALFPFAPGPGIGEDELWVSYAVPEALALDLMADEFFAPIATYWFEETAKARGFASLAEAPLVFKRELAQESYAAFMAVGEIDRVDDRYRVTLRMYRIGDASLAAETTHEGTDLLALVDSMSGPVKTALEIPAREGIEDLPVRGRLSENDAAVEAFFKGLLRRYAWSDREAAIEYLNTATTLDPTFTVAQYMLSEVVEVFGDGATDPLTPLVAAMENLYRMPERYGFRVRADYYRLTGERDRAQAVGEMWVELYPNDLHALRNQSALQRLAGDWGGMLATLDVIQRLNPLDGSVFISKAWAQQELGNDDQASALLTEYTERFPGEVRGYIRLADLHRGKGLHEKVREYLERLSVLEPLETGWTLQLAALDLDVGRLDEARARYERVLDQARTPVTRARARVGLGEYHRRRGEIADAIRSFDVGMEGQDDYRRWISIVPGGVEGILVYLEAGRADRVTALIEDWRAAFPPGERWDVDVSRLRLTLRLALKVEGVDAALEAHRQASEVVEGVGSEHYRAVLLGDLGLIRERAGDHAGAAESFRAAIALRPEAAYYRGAGRALRLAARLDEAAVELQEALRLIPADPRAHMEMALVLEAKGDIGGAVEHRRSALAVWENADADFEPAREARVKLAELGG